MSTGPRQDAADRAYLAELDAAADKASGRFSAAATNPRTTYAELDEVQRAAESAEGYRDEAWSWYQSGAALVTLNMTDLEAGR